MCENAMVIIINGNRTIRGRVTSIEFEQGSIGEVFRGTVSFYIDDIKDEKEQVTKKPEKEEYNWRYE